MSVQTVLCPLSIQTLIDDGKPLIGAKIYIFDSGTTTPKTVYKDHLAQASHPRPILTNAQGRIPPIYVGSGSYRVRILRPNNVPIEDVDGLDGAVSGATPDEPGQTYPLTDADSVLRTGDVIWSYRTGLRKGFSPCNGGTIGQADSGASNIAYGGPSNLEQPVGSAYDLFRFLWENDDLLPVYASGVSVPRGGTAIADWDANRTIGVPDLRGRSLMGLDTMGATAANVIQVATTITMTKGSAEAVLGSVTGICAGMSVIASGIPSGATITKIDGLTVTLSSLPTSSASGAHARLSMFGDAQKLGRMGGSAVHTLTEEELAAHRHDATSTTAASGSHAHSGWTDVQGWHAHGYADVYVDPGLGMRGGGSEWGVHVTQRVTDGSGNHAHNVTTHAAGDHSHAAFTEIAQAGKGMPHNNVSPALLGTFYIKL